MLERPLAITDWSAVRYLGFWPRVAAYVLDAIVVTGLQAALTFLVYGAIQVSATPAPGQGIDIGALVFSNAIALVFTLGLWVRFSATPGKMLFRSVIVDARTGGVPRTWQWVVRYFGILLSTIPLGAGLVMAAFHPRKQCLHDLLARTCVVVPDA